MRGTAGVACQAGLHISQQGHFFLMRANFALKNPTMELFRYRKPSLNTLYGVTAAKRRLKTGARDIPGRSVDETVHGEAAGKQWLSLHSPADRVIREAARGNFPSFLGLFSGKRR